MRRLLALSAVVALGLIVVGPGRARAQGNGPCIHQGRQVQCPPGLPPGSQSINFVPGGTNWRNSMTGAIVFVPSTTFPPFMPTPSPTAPPGPTTQPGPTPQPGPGTQPGGSSTAGPATTEGVLALTRPSDRAADTPLPTPQEFREKLLYRELQDARAAEEKAREARRKAEAPYAQGSTDPNGLATKDRTVTYRGKYPDTEVVVLRITPELRAASERYWKLSNEHFGEEKKQGRRLPYSEEFKQAGKDFDAAFDAAPIDQAATDEVRRAREAEEKAEKTRQAAQDDYDDAVGNPPSIERQLRERLLKPAEKPPVQESDADKAPRFEPFQDQKATEDVM
jgi:hypothetical protein